MKPNKICQLFNIEVPIIQAGMVWCSGWRLASAVSNAGGLGLIGAGSMSAELLEEHILKCKAATQKPFGVNLPLLYKNIEQQVEVLLRHQVKIVFTSAGNPKTWTAVLKEKGITVVHVVSSVKFAQKAQDAGVDAVVAEGFEAGGHNGREETTTFCLIPEVRKVLNIPLIAAGGIGSGRTMLAAMVLGADGVQIGSRFAASMESSAHENFKKRITETQEGETIVTLKQLTPVRLIKNKFYESVHEAETKGASEETLRELLGKGRSKKGIFEGDLEEGELEIGQVAASIKSVLPAAQIVKEIMKEYEDLVKSIK
ncbi:MAG TPA: nitronate monooxygenase [Cytophagaceae bacterium]|nr:nitronate monooxygenase [Cytophagaceae bacterium]